MSLKAEKFGTILITIIGAQNLRHADQAVHSTERGVVKEIIEIRNNINTMVHEDITTVWLK